MSKTNYKNKKKKKGNKKKYNKNKVVRKVSTPIKENIDKSDIVEKEVNNNDINVNKIIKLKEKNYNLTIFYFICFIYLELLYQVLTFSISNVFTIKTIYYSVFALISSIIFSFITKTFKKNIARKIAIGLVVFFSLYYFASYLFKSIFNTYFSIHLLGVSDQAIAFMGTTISLVLKNLPILILFLIPVIVVFKLRKKISYKVNKKKLNIIVLLISLILFIFMININKEVNELFYHVDNNAMNMEKLGVNISTYLDIKRIFFKINEQIDLNSNVDGYEASDEEIKEYGYNIVDIDFDSLIENESDSKIKDMHEYISKNGATLKNEYTGKYKDKNLVVFMAESLNEIAISQEYTPTLYKLAHEGLEFTNFYTPINLSTLGGEFQNLTSLFANLSMLSQYFRKGTNYFPYGLGTVYQNIGYSVSAYHANSGTFQDRNKYLKSLGFEKFIYNGNGLEEKMNCKEWPQSDLDMVNVTMDDYINEEKFMTYYVSVSGHMPWSFSGNAMSKKNKDLVSDSNYSEEAAAYIAANIELDRAVESLINKLEETGKLDDTVIAIVPDHYPYSMDIDTINELSTYERDTTFEVNHSTLILYNSLDEHEVIDKVSTQLDFIPTLYNLFGIEYDSRLFMGKDILSTSEGLAYFTDRSWISDKGRYIASTNTFVLNDGEEVDDTYVDNINKIVSSRINMSKLIMENDYYRKVFK